MERYVSFTELLECPQSWLVRCQYMHDVIVRGNDLILDKAKGFFLGYVPTLGDQRNLVVVLARVFLFVERE